MGKFSFHKINWGTLHFIYFYLTFIVLKAEGHSSDFALGYIRGVLSVIFHLKETYRWKLALLSQMNKCK